jgi:hypothetical protein
MTIKAQETFFWGLLKRPVRELGSGDEIWRLGMIDPFSKEGAAEIARFVNPDEMSMHQRLVGGIARSDERPLKIKIRGKETDRLVKDEISEHFGWQTLGDIIIGYDEKVWWEPTPEGDMSQARRK